MDADPVKDAVANFPGGPLALLLILGIPLFFVTAAGLYYGIRMAYQQDPRRRHSRLERDTAAQALEQMDEQPER